MENFKKKKKYNTKTYYPKKRFEKHNDSST